MGRLLIVLRLAAHDLRRRWSEAALLLLAMTAATATLTLGLVLNGVTSQPYQTTRAATHGPDITAQSGFTDQGTTSPADLAALDALKHAPYVRAYGGPYPMATVVFRTGPLTAGADVEGRQAASASIDQPKVTAGSWIRPGGVVVERTFATAAHLHLGQRITLARHPFTVVGFAVTAAFSPYPELGCQTTCTFGPIQIDSSDTGLMWTTEPAVRNMVASVDDLTYFLNLGLTHPSHAAAISERVDANVGGGPTTATTATSPTAPFFQSWEQTSRQDANLVRNERTVLLVGSWLLALLAVAGVAVLVGGRMAGQIRRVGLLKSIGGTPGLVAAVLMAEYVVVALFSAAIGLVAAWLFAPVLTAPGNGLLGSAPTPPLTMATVLVVVVVALGVAVLAALVPTLRAARTSTVRALADSARAPRRSPLLINLSRRLPVPFMIAFRVMGRRIRRTALSLLSVFVTVSGIVAVLIADIRLIKVQNAVGKHFAGNDLLINPRNQAADHVLLIVTVMLVALAAVNAVFITRAIAQDARHASAITRALGATPQQVTVGLSGAQALPAMFGALLGIPGGYGLYDAVKHGGQSATIPPAVDMLLVLIGSAIVVSVLTALPARWSARRPVAQILQAEFA